MTKEEEESIKIPFGLTGIYVSILLQFVGVVFMSGVVWTKLDYQSKAIDELKITVFQDMDDRWKKKDHDSYATQVENRIRTLEVFMYNGQTEKGGKK